MISYFLRRLLLLPLTVLVIISLTFILVQFAPGGPVEQAIARLEGDAGSSALSRISGGGGTGAVKSGNGGYRGSKGLPPAVIEQLKKQFGFDKPPHERYIKMVKNFAMFDLGTSFFKGKSVWSLIISKMPVSISLGLWTLLIVYATAIPLGIKKAFTHGSRFDIWTSFIVVTGYAIPAFLMGVFLIVLFAGGRYLDWFPLGGLVSDNWDSLPFFAKIGDYLWHMVLPVTAMTIGSFATLTMLVKNSFLDQISQQYTLTAKAKGLTPNKVLYRHVFRNAMLVVIAGFPATFIGVLFTGSLLIEVIFNLDGLGYLGYEAALTRDYPLVFGTLYVYSLVGLLMNVVTDMIYMMMDPRIDFNKVGE